MIEGIFTQPNYLAAKKSLDAIALRQEAIATNLANLETPGFKRLDLAPNFEKEFERACAAREPQQIASLKPSLAVDPTAVAHGLDGNTVSLENELMQLNQNMVAHTLETQLVTGTLLKLKLAITGRS
jgi:flagellar basal-body rod protein FlgB